MVSKEIRFDEMGKKKLGFMFWECVFLVIFGSDNLFMLLLYNDKQKGYFMDNDIFPGYFQLKTDVFLFIY